MTTGDRYPGDPGGDWLREQLDHELAGVRSRPGALHEVLERGRGRLPWWRRGLAGVPVWVVAAAAVLVVALAVPVGLTALRDTPPDRLASPALPLAGTAGPGVASRPATPPTLRSSPRASTPPRPTSPPTEPGTTTSPLQAAPSGVPADRCTVLPAPAPTATATASADLDGDGQPDTISAPGSVLTVRLTHGAAVTYPLDTASPYVAVLPVETDAGPGAELLVITRGAVGGDGSLGMRAVLYDVAGCAFGPVPNAQGTPYTFEIGSSASDSRRAGVACDGGRLLGVTSERDAGGGWSVTRTPVTSAGGKARNGAATTLTLAPGDPAVDALATATCAGATPQSLG